MAPNEPGRALSRHRMPGGDGGLRGTATEAPPVMRAPDAPLGDVATDGGGWPATDWWKR